MNVGMIVDDLGPRRTYTGRAGDPRSLVLNKDILQDVSVITEITAQYDRLFYNSHRAKDFAFYLDLFIILIWNLDTLLEEFLWCGGWAYSALGAFALSCPLCLHSVFCAQAQLLGPVLLSLPVFAFGGWGVSVASTSRCST